MIAIFKILKLNSRIYLEFRKTKYNEKVDKYKLKD